MTMAKSGQTITVVSDHAFNITERDPEQILPPGVHVGGLVTTQFVPGENIVPARLRDHWALKAHKVVIKE
jgi:hypothetical protein